MAITSLIFLAFFAVGLIAAVSIRPIYGLYTYVAIFYLHPPSRWWGAWLPDLRWSLLPAAVTLIALFIHRNTLSPPGKLYHSKLFIFLSCYVIWMWLQWPFVLSPFHSQGVILFTKYLLLFFLIFTIVDNEKDFLGFCFAHVLGCAYFGYLIWQASDVGRLHGVGGPGVDDANNLGMHLTTGLIFGAFLLLRLQGYMRIAVLFMIPLILNGIIQTETRGALIGLFLGGLVTVLLKPKSIRKKYYSLALLALAGIMFMFATNVSLQQRVETLGAAVNQEQEWDGSAESRIFIALAQFEMFSDYPFGVGHQGTAILSQQYLDSRWLAKSTGNRSSHNTVLSVLVDQGIIGITLYVLLAFCVAGVLFRIKRMDKKGLGVEYGLYNAMIGGSIVSIIGAGMFAQNLKAEIQIWCLALLAILVNLATKSLEKK